MISMVYFLWCFTLVHIFQCSPDWGYGLPLALGVKYSLPKCQGGMGMLVTKKVIQYVQKNFNEDAQASALEWVTLYGNKPEEPDAEAVRLAILKLAEGNLEQLKTYVRMAKEDYEQVMTAAGG